MTKTVQHQKESIFQFYILAAFFLGCLFKAFHITKMRQELARFNRSKFNPRFE